MIVQQQAPERTARGSMNPKARPPMHAAAAWLCAGGLGFLLLGGTPASLLADTLYLRDGTVLQGRIVGQNRQSVTLKIGPARRTIPKVRIRRLTYGPAPDSVEAARLKKVAEERRREAMRRRAEELERAEAQKRQDEERRKAEEARKEQEQERERQDAARKKQEEEQKRTEALQRKREEDQRQAEEQKKKQEDQQQEEVLRKKAEADRQEQEAIRMKEEEERRRRQTEAQKKQEALELARRLQHERSRGIFVLSGGRELAGVVTKIENGRLFLKTTTGLLILDRGDIEKVRIQAKNGPAVLGAADIRGEIEPSAKELAFSNRKITRAQLQSRGTDHYVDTGKGLIRLTEEEAAEYGLRGAPPPGAEPGIGQYGVARLRGGTDVHGTLVSRDANEVVIRTDRGLIYLLTPEIVYMRSAAQPRPASFFDRLLGRSGR